MYNLVSIFGNNFIEGGEIIKSNFSLIIVVEFSEFLNC